MQMIFQTRRRFIVFVLAVNFIMYDQAAKYLLDGFNSLFLAASPTGWATVASWNVPGAGLEVMPPKVKTAVEIMRAHPVADFAPVGLFNEDDELFQRLAEGAYPIMIYPDSNQKIGVSTDPSIFQCSTLVEENHVRLSRCN